MAIEAGPIAKLLLMFAVLLILGVSPKGTTLPNVAMAAIPYLLCDALLVIALILVPGIALYLPSFL